MEVNKPILEHGKMARDGFELRSAIVYQSEHEAQRSVAGSRNVRGLRVKVEHRWMRVARVSIPVWVALVFQKAEQSEAQQ